MGAGSCGLGAVCDGLRRRTKPRWKPETVMFEASKIHAVGMFRM